MDLAWAVSVPGRIVSKKNSKRIIRVGRFPRIISSAQYLKFEKEVSVVLRRHLPPKSIRGKLLFELCVNLKNRQHEPDLSNLLEGPQDVFQELGIIENDKQIVRIVAEKTFDPALGDMWTARLYRLED